MADWVRFQTTVQPGSTQDLTYTVGVAAGRILQDISTRIYPGAATQLAVEMYIVRSGTLIRESILLLADGSDVTLSGENDTFEQERLGIPLWLGDTIHVRVTNTSAPPAELPISVQMRLDSPGRPAVRRPEVARRG